MPVTIDIDSIKESVNSLLPDKISIKCLGHVPILVANSVFEISFNSN